MSELICNLPSIDVYVRKEYLKDHQDGHGEFVKGVWVTAKSIPGRAFYFPPLFRVQKHLNQILVYQISSFGIVWIME